MFTAESHTEVTMNTFPSWTNLRINFIPIRLTKVKNPDAVEFWWGCEERGLTADVPVNCAIHCEEQFLWIWNSGHGFSTHFRNSTSRGIPSRYSHLYAVDTRHYCTIVCNRKTEKITQVIIGKWINKLWSWNITQQLILMNFDYVYVNAWTSKT